MTSPDSLLVERPSDAIVVFRLSRPQVRNALNLEVRTRLADEVTRHRRSGLGGRKTVKQKGNQNAAGDQRGSVQKI